MKAPASTWFAGFVSFSAAGLIFISISACKKSTPKDSLPPPTYDVSASPENAQQQRLKWSLKTSVKAYEQAGHANPRWDEAAKRALTEFARSRAQIPGTQPEVISTNVAAAVQAGCDDPMVNYLFIKYAMDQTNTKEAFTSAFYKTALAMEASSYPPIRKFYAGFRAIEQYCWANNYPTNWRSDISALSHRTTDYLSAVLKDSNTPAAEIYDACHDYLNMWGKDKDAYPKIWLGMEPLVFKNWSNDSSICLLKGEACIRMAWLARGTGYATNVSEQGWKTFFDRLTIADSALTNAWNINPNDERIAINMIRVAEGRQKSRDEMDLWFGRAMMINPNSFLACEQKLHYLYPQWYGSRDDMVAFGRQCVASTNWGGNVPLILANAHREYWLYLNDSEEKTNYWKQPEVWPDLKTSFDRFFELNPDAIGYYHNYAWYAYHAEQWSELNEIIPKLGPVNYDYFGGKDEFNKMVQLAKAHGGKPK